MKFYLGILQTKCSHPQRPGCFDSPISHQCTKNPAQNQCIVIPLGRSPQTHPGTRELFDLVLLDRVHSCKYVNLRKLWV